MSGVGVHLTDFESSVKGICLIPISLPGLVKLVVGRASSCDLIHGAQAPPSHGEDHCCSGLAMIGCDHVIRRAADDAAAGIDQYCHPSMTENPWAALERKCLAAEQQHGAVVFTPFAVRPDVNLGAALAEELQVRRRDTLIFIQINSGAVQSDSISTHTW